MIAVRIAMCMIWGAAALLGVAILLFSFAIHERADVGSVFAATVLLGMAGTTVCVLLLGGSALGIYAMVRQAAVRRPAPIVSVLAGSMGGTFLAWIAWNFWTN